MDDPISALDAEVRK